MQEVLKNKSDSTGKKKKKVDIEITNQMWWQCGSMRKMADVVWCKKESTWPICQLCQLMTLGESALGSLV